MHTYCRVKQKGNPTRWVFLNKLSTEMGTLCCWVCLIRRKPRQKQKPRQRFETLRRLPSGLAYRDKRVRCISSDISHWRKHNPWARISPILKCVHCAARPTRWQVFKLAVILSYTASASVFCRLQVLQIQRDSSMTRAALFRTGWWRRQWVLKDDHFGSTCPKGFHWFVQVWFVPENLQDCLRFE